ncbi:MAG TPA: choice-of-anchor tandem repeat GloVer-containing protein, partial [Chthonomonadales bacterium]|nr:choice-of-anchor tandem repeat GloVer-containing protein [Chthonomonadales bacterium]
MTKSSIYAGRAALCIALGLLPVLSLQFPASAQRVVIPIHQFAAAGAEGAETTSMIQGPDGSFYATAVAGGANNTGAILKVTPGGAVTVLYSFSATTTNLTTGLVTNADGEAPAALVVGPDGNLYGTANGAGPNGTGTIFR